MGLFMFHQAPCCYFHLKVLVDYLKGLFLFFNGVAVFDKIKTQWSYDAVDVSIFLNMFKSPDESVKD